MFYIKKHITKDRRLVLAVADSSIIGKTFKEENAILDIKESFYKGEKATVEDVKKLFRQAYMINIVGKKAIELAKEQGIVENLKDIASIPYAHIISVEEQ